MNGIKAIETEWNGYRFRSRLEARWAVFFDALGLSFDYEREGFDLGDAGYYLPDFWLPSLKAWVEIKPLDDGNKEETIARCHALSVAAQTYVLLIAGSPGHDSEEISVDYELTVFGGMPWDMFGGDGVDSEDDWFEAVWMHGHHGFESLRKFIVTQVEKGDVINSDDAQGAAANVLDEKFRREWLVELDRLYYRRKYGCEHPKWRMRSFEGRWRFSSSAWVEVSHRAWCYPDLEPEVKRALDLARSARFEHGEKPRVRA